MGRPGASRRGRDDRHVRGLALGQVLAGQPFGHDRYSGAKHTCAKVASSGWVFELSVDELKEGRYPTGLVRVRSKIQSRPPRHDVLAFGSIRDPLAQAP